MNINRYTRRIKYHGELMPTLAVLKQLQQAHLYQVPFENLDVHRNVKIDLKRLYNKVVQQNRGGFCYELNGLFFELLQKIGFDVKMISARVYNHEKKEYGPEFDHLAIIAMFPEANYQVDVGFGDFIMHPLKIVMNEEQQDPGGIFKMQEFPGGYISVLRKDAAGLFKPGYIFTETAQRFDAFEGMCEYHQTSAQSPFTQKILCTKPVQGGRITITENTLKITTGKFSTTEALPNDKEILAALETYFGIVF